MKLFVESVDPGIKDGDNVGLKLLYLSFQEGDAVYHVSLNKAPERVPTHMILQFQCLAHEEMLQGTPMLVEEGRPATFTLDLSEMYCPSDNHAEPCADSWEVTTKVVIS
jgi:hypothetical protein